MLAISTKRGCGLWENSSEGHTLKSKLNNQAVEGRNQGLSNQSPTDLSFRPVRSARSQGVPNLNRSPGAQGTATFGADENVLKWIMVMVAQHCEYTKKQ